MNIFVDEFLFRLNSLKEFNGIVKRRLLLSMAGVSWPSDPLSLHSTAAICIWQAQKWPENMYTNIQNT